MSIGSRLGDQRPKLQQSDATTMIMTNAFDYSYSGDIFVGSKGQSHEVVYDTGSDWLCLESSDCEQCQAEKFKYKESASFKQLQSESSVREYGSASLMGFEVTDLTCIVPHTEDEISKGNTSFCKQDFEFFLVTKQKGLNEKYSGVCGLARSKFKPAADERDLGPLLVK